jgi:hypothetical protein
MTTVIQSPNLDLSVKEMTASQFETVGEIQKHAQAMLDAFPGPLHEKLSEAKRLIEQAVDLATLAVVELDNV